MLSSDGEEVGKVLEVLDNLPEHIFDGLVIETVEGERRFVDAPEVARTAERAVTLTITAAEWPSCRPRRAGAGGAARPRRRLKRLLRPPPLSPRGVHVTILGKERENDG